MKISNKINIKFWIKIWNKIGEFAASLSLPLISNIVALFQTSAIADSGAAYIDSRQGAGDYLAGKGVSLAFSGTQYGQLVDDAEVATSVALVGDFTIEFKCYFPSVVPGMILFSGDNTTEGFVDIFQGKLGITVGAAGTQDFSTALTDATVHTVILTRVGVSLTQTLDGVTSTPVFCKNNNLVIRFMGRYLNGNYLIASLWDVLLTDSTGIKFSNFLAQGGTSGFCESQVGPTLQMVGFTVSGCFTESLTYGHVWDNYSEYVSADAQYSGVHLVTGKVPQDIDNPSLDIFGNTLMYPGVGRNDLVVKGYTGSYNGSTYIATGSIPINGGYTIIIKYIPTQLNIPVANFRLFGCDGVGGSRTYGSISLWGAVAQTTGVQFNVKQPDLTVGVVNIIEFNASNDGVTTVCSIKLDGVLKFSGSFAQSSILMPSLWFGSTYDVSLSMPSGSIIGAKVYDSDGDLIRNFVVESKRDATQSTIYNTVGTVHGSLVGATLGAGGFWSTEKPGSELLEGGYRDDGTNLIPAQSGSTTTAADGNPLTSQPGEFSGSAVKVYAPSSKAFYDMCVLAGIETDLYLDGEAIGLTPDQWRALFPAGNLADCMFMGDQETFLIGYNPVLSAEDATKAEAYMGIV